MHELVSTDYHLEYFPCQQDIQTVINNIPENDIISFINKLTNCLRKRQLNQFFETDESINLMYGYIVIPRESLSGRYNEIPIII